MTVKHALSLPPSGEFADPRVYTDLAAAAEENGWDGLFLWDHVLRPSPEPPELADPWICFAVIAQASTTLRFGPLVTPITRRRPIKLAREVITLDRLSDGRMILGLGLGVDTGGELSRFGEIVDPVVRGQRLDEGADLLDAIFSGDRVEVEGEHFRFDGVTVLPRPIQRPRVPMWFAARGGADRPVRRAARFDGLFPIEMGADRLREVTELIERERGTLDGFDLVMRPGDGLGYERLVDLGATWILAPIKPGATLDEALRWAGRDPSTAFASMPPPG